MKQDEWLAEFLTARRRSRSDGDTLTLASDEVTMRLAPSEVTPTRPLQNTPWRLDAVVSGGGADGTASSVPAGRPAPEDQVHQRRSSAGTSRSPPAATRATGRWRSAPRSWTSATLVTTKMACPDAVGALETTFLGVLGRGTTYTLEGDRLTLTAADGKSGLVFVAG